MRFEARFAEKPATVRVGGQNEQSPSSPEPAIRFSPLLRIALAFAIISSLAVVLVAAGAVSASRSARVGSVRIACGRPDPGRWAYRWPVKPFDRPHPVRGNFGDPRTLFLRPLHRGGLEGPGAFSFHDGVDISAHPRTPVYPVVSGRARVLGSEAVEVRTTDDRRFVYRHIHVVVKDRASVDAGKTVLGFAIKPWRHVHLTEIDPITVRGLPDSGYQVVNPLTHLDPFGEAIPPVIRSLEVRSHRRTPVSPTRVRGVVRLIIDAFDFPAVPIPGVWHDMPVAPAWISWGLTNRTGRTVIRPRTVVDFERTIPPDRRFWKVYARGTYQNFPVIGTHYLYGQRGRLLYYLDRHFDSTLLRNGLYHVVIRVGDICNNQTLKSIPIRIANSPT